MINNVSNNQTDFIPVPTPPNNISSHTLTEELKNIAPKVADELLSLYSEEKVEQLLHQQLSSLLTVTKEPKISNYQHSDEELALKTVLSSQQEGLLNNENSDQLMQRLNRSVRDIRTTYTNTSDILASLGQLGHEQKSFLASSEQRVERALGSYMESINRSANEDNDNYRFELSVTTKEGDIINITFNSSQGYDEKTGNTVDGFGLSYQVEGELSKAEHLALKEVLSGVGEMADEFFNISQNPYGKHNSAKQSSFDLDFLANFNHQQLSAFDVSFSTSEGPQLVSSENNLDLSYKVDHVANQQALTFKSQTGINYTDFSLDMSTFGGKDVKQMQQYMATLDQNLEETRKNSKGDNESSAFGKQGDSDMRQGFAIFKGAFASMSSAAQRYTQLESVAAQEFSNSRAMVADLVDNMITKDPRYQGLGNKANNTLGEGISKLADFNAKFSFSKESEGPSLRPKASIQMSQVTEQQQSGELTGLTQNKMVKSHFDYQLTRPDYYSKTENYQIGTAVKNNELLGLDQHHQEDIDQKTYRLTPKTPQYELMMERTESVTNESKVRLIDDIWIETNENKQDMEKRERVGNSGKGRPEDFKNTNHHSHDKLMTIIGDLDKLAENKNLKREYLIELGNVNFFMDNKN